MEKVTIKTRYPSGLTVLEIEDDEKIATKSFIGFRVGLSWPMATNPGGFFCIAGQGNIKMITGEAPITVVNEFEAKSFGSLAEKMFDDMGLFGAEEIYTDMSQRFHSFIQDLDAIRRAKRPSQRIIIKPAPFAASFLHGENLIRRWFREIKGLTLQKNSAIRSQLREIRLEDLKGDATEKFYAINALRYVIGAFETSTIQPKAGMTLERDLPVGSWT